MCLWANRHFTECACEKICILRNVPMDKYLFYGQIHNLKNVPMTNIYSTECAYGQIHILRMHLLGNRHSMKWAFRQIYILQNEPTFYGVGLRANTHSMEYAYMQINTFYRMCFRANKHSTEGADMLTNILWNVLTEKNIAKSILFVRNMNAEFKLKPIKGQGPKIMISV